MIEDESGSIFWGYGHLEAHVFVAEVNRWMRHVGVDDDELPNLWARRVADDFKLTDNKKENDDSFPRHTPTAVKPGLTPHSVLTQGDQGRDPPGTYNSCRSTQKAPTVCRRGSARGDPYDNENR